ncbi:F-box protein skip16 [Cymbomonas tetramitiformis]|uniref:F-box protein skip16 n=1 Tax=Cymbomonas tetramitiformis TaxID=36881 RepID=A0AAE0GDH1_9CHLO|nr:F-box protein skip16 [Cymbomonas tetramitiformis]
MQSPIKVNEAIKVVDNLDQETLCRVFSFLTAKECCIASCVQRSWRVVSSSDVLWRGFAWNKYQLKEPSRTPASTDDSELSFKEAFVAWENEYGKYSEAGVFARAKRCWAELEDWTRAHHEGIHESLGTGASEENLDSAEMALGVTFPPAMRVLYRLHDGQTLSFDEAEDNGRHVPGISIFHGLLGSYAFYDHMVSVRLLPLHRIVRWTAFFKDRRLVPEELMETHILLATSPGFQKRFYLDTSTGQVHVLCRAPHHGGWHRGGSGGSKAALPAIPAADTPGCPRDGFLRWMEEYARRLQSGVYTMAPSLLGLARYERQRASRCFAMLLNL